MRTCENKKIEGIGITLPGRFHQDSNRLIFAPNLKWRDVDLRNPIAVVRASAQMAQRQMGRGDPEGALARLKAIVEQTDRLTDMLDVFLDAARVNGKKFPMRIEKVDLREVVEIAAERARVLLSEPGDRVLECSIPEGCVGAWDKPRIVRAVRQMQRVQQANHDLTQRKAAELEQFAGRVAHDILSPLSAVSMAMGLVEKNPGQSGEALQRAQSSLFRGNCCKQRRPPGFRIERRPGARHLDQHAAAGCVVHCAVVNRIAVYGRPNSQMVPVRGEHHGL